MLIPNEDVNLVKKNSDIYVCLRKGIINLS